MTVSSWWTSGQSGVARARCSDRCSRSRPRSTTDITFGKVDTEAQVELAQAFEIRSIPTLMAVRDGVVLYSQPGALPAADLEDLIGQLARGRHGRGPRPDRRPRGGARHRAAHALNQSRAAELTESANESGRSPMEISDLFCHGSPVAAPSLSCGLASIADQQLRHARPARGGPTRPDQPQRVVLLVAGQRSVDAPRAEPRRRSARDRPPSGPGRAPASIGVPLQEHRP